MFRRLHNPNAFPTGADSPADRTDEHRHVPRRILVLNWRDMKHPEAGGAERYLLEIARSLQSKGHRVTWLTAGFPGSTFDDEIDGIEIIRMGNRFTVYLAIPLFVLFRLRGRFDAVIDAENGIPFFSPLFTRKPKVCLIFHVHQRVFEAHLPFPLSTIFKWLEARAMPTLYRRAGFIAISRDTLDDLVALGVPSGSIELAYSGYDSGLGPLPKTERPSILCVGRLKKYKRVDAVLRAFAVVRRTMPDATLTIAGTGEEEPSLRALAAQLDLGVSVRFEGFVSEARKRELYARSWAFVMASEMEGWGLTIIEAAACATPTVAVAVPGVREAVIDGKSGVLVDGITDLPVAIERVLRDGSLREMLARGALDRSQAFSWDRAADTIVATLAR